MRTPTDSRALERPRDQRNYYTQPPAPPAAVGFALRRPPQITVIPNGTSPHGDYQGAGTRSFRSDARVEVLLPRGPFLVASPSLHRIYNL